ncbi:hypothetical protein [Paraburkholderia phytofirmans]|uniref:hypothetical protein n=1 Tax=Paraburkholderia phytofirmans TaxID=261302 RepID=UPI001F27D993|nr:hypothetical protein [Paraburkholderia phytofirmans]
MTLANAEARTQASGWPVDDITGLGRRLPEVDPATYFDEQARESYQLSLVKWPVLARLMKLAPRDEAAASSVSSVSSASSASSVSDIHQPAQAAAAG